MKETIPSWPQTALIVAFGMVAILLGYLLSRMRGDWGPSAWVVLVLFLVAGAGFALTVLLFYLRPQYGAGAFPFMLALLLGHAVVVAVLWRIGVFGR